MFYCVGIILDNTVTISPCRGSSIFPATNYSTSLLVEDCSQEYYIPLLDKEIKGGNTLVESQIFNFVANIKDTSKPSSLD